MMGRPRSDHKPIVVLNVKLLLYSPEDDDLIELYESRIKGTRNGAKIVKAAMRSGAALMVEKEADIADDDMADVLDDLVL